MSGAAAIRQHIAELEAQLAGLRMALSAVEGAEASSAKVTLVWQDALRKQCVLWSKAVKSGLKAQKEGTVGQKKYPDGKIPLAAVTNRTAWTIDFPTIPINELGDNGFRLVDEDGNKYLILPVA
jgi:hypothetical protein